MSMLSSQADELRDRAKVLRQGDWSDGADDAALMEQAADTIEKLEPYSNQLEPSRYSELFGTPERTARTISVTAKCVEPATVCRDCVYKGYCDTECDYHSLLEWLRCGA